MNYRCVCKHPVLKKQLEKFITTKKEQGALPMSTKKMILASVLVSCFALSSVVEARGGTGGSGGDGGRGGRSDGSGIGSAQSIGRSSSGCSSCGGHSSYGENYRSYGRGFKKSSDSSCPARDFRGRGERGGLQHVGGDLPNEGLRTPK